MLDNKGKKTFNPRPFLKDVQVDVNYSILHRIGHIALYSKIKSRCLTEPRHKISNNVVCATSKASDQPAHARSLIRAFAIRLNIL